MDVLSNTNVYGELRAVKIRQSFTNLFDIGGNEFSTYFVPVVTSVETHFNVGETEKLIIGYFFKKFNPPLIQALDINSGKQVLLEYSFVFEYGEDVGQYKAIRSDSSTEQHLLFTIVGIMENDTDGPQI